MAIHMALDLGLNVSSEYWKQDGEATFSIGTVNMRERIWYGCIHLDRFVPTSIQKNNKVIC